MADTQKPGLVSLRDRREAVLETLGAGFADDLIDEDTLEQRVALAHAATSLAALDELVRDIEPALVAAPKTSALVPVSPELGALFGSIERRGPFVVPETMTARATFGSIVIDLRDASFQSSVSTIEVDARFGNVEIIVPPDVVVACDGRAVFGSFTQHRNRGAGPIQAVLERLIGLPSADDELEGDRPLLRVTGRAVFANVEVKVRSRGGKRRKQPKALAGKAQKALPEKSLD